MFRGTFSSLALRRVSITPRRLPQRQSILRPLSVDALEQSRKPLSRQAVDSYLTSHVLDLLSLKGRTVVITGAGRGIGLALAFAVAEAGGKVAIVDAANAPHEHYAKLQEICEETRYYKSDVTDYERLEATFADIAKDFGRIDGIVTAAGICPDEPFLERKPQSVKRTFEINSLGTYYSAQLAARQMLKQPKLTPTSNAGSIVFIASIAAHTASLGQYTSDYCSSKGAVLSLSRQLSVELARPGIRVNCISPGLVNHIISWLRSVLIEL
ncbi:hypothetical protein LTR86_006934 [Recurvomyces mirabilis]|nr:hypothetical protein LTR86_006934 [Recurvomyces mirabilis]